MTEGMTNGRVIRIIGAGPECAELLARLQSGWSSESAWIDRPWDAGAWRGVLAMPGCFALVATRGDEPIGLAAARTAANEAELLLIAVAPEARRGGVGGALLAAVVARGRAAGADHLFLEVAEGNDPALGLYDTAGFVIVGRRTDYYEFGNCRTAALVMARRLAD